MSLIKLLKSGAPVEVRNFGQILLELAFFCVARVALSMYHGGCGHAYSVRNDVTSGLATKINAEGFFEPAKSMARVTSPGGGQGGGGVGVNIT